METVKINSRRDLVWADDVLTPSEEGGTVIGIICGEIGSDPATRYWKLESDGFLIYKEIISDDANHGLQHTDFFGPGGISLEPNRKVSN